MTASSGPDVSLESDPGAIDVSDTLAADPSEYRILVVDDDSTVLESCRSLLETAGYRVECVRKGAEAIRLLTSRSFQIALVDRKMPEVDGFGVLEVARKESPETLVIMMTGYASAEGGVQAVQAGAWDYLPKPFTATQLSVLVGRATHRLSRIAETLAPGPDGGPCWWCATACAPT